MKTIRPPAKVQRSSIYSRVRNLEGKSNWEKFEFPTADFSLRLSCTGYWIGVKHTLTRPFCWTPVQPFWFGDRRFISLYPAQAFETKNFGWVIQRGPDGVTVGKE